ncbi:MAG: arylsulfatase, partial [Alistipes sp.]|nr:arylsulfatase [Alistipes sp.]
GLTDDSLVSLSDFYATFAEMDGYELSDDEAEDSYSIWSNITRTGTTARKDLVSLSGFGYLAMRIPDLKLVFWCGSGGQSYPSKPEDLAGLPDMQLYDMNADAGERNNLIDDPKYRNTVEELTARMRRYVNDGRSTPGKPQRNDTGNDWEQTKLF